MNVLNKVLNNLTSIWNIVPKEIPAITISKGNGTHNMVSIDTTQLYFHSASYNKDMPVAQTIYLDDYTIDELLETIKDLGYTASLSSEAAKQKYGARKACILLETINTPLSSSVVLYAFTSNLWQLLYPITRGVDAWSTNMDSAIPQLYANTTDGKWLDYWASFFNVQRTNNESDESVRKNMFMNLADVKTNNVALAELVSLITKSKVTVLDIEPAVFEITIDPSYMSTAGDVHSVIDAAKGGGIKYYLNYTGVYNTEDFKAWYKDKTGKDFSTNDKPASSASLGIEELEAYGMYQPNYSLMLNVDEIGVDGATMQLVVEPFLMKDTAVMTLTLNGATVQSGAV